MTGSADPTNNISDTQLRQGVRRSMRWLRALEDTQAGPVGKVACRAFNRVAAREIADEALRVNAVFRGFIWPPNKGQSGFQNIIAYNQAVSRDPARFFAARTHEYIHALQYSSAAAMNTDPFNAASDIALGPLAYVQRKERLEQDAYVKGAWLQSLLAQKQPGCANVLDRTPLGVQDFLRLRADCGGDLGLTLSRAAVFAANAQGNWLDTKSRHPARDLWHYLALREYEGILKARARSDKMPPVYVRMGLADIREIGATLGVNTFGNVAQAMALPELSAQNKKLLKEIEKRFSIPAHDTMPTVSEALAARDMPAHRFIKQSRQYKGP